VALLHRQKLPERRTTAGLAFGEDHLADDRQPVLRHEHVLCAAEADALRTELARLDGVCRCVGIPSDAEPAVVVPPPEDRLEIVVHLWRGDRDPPPPARPPAPPRRPAP